LPFSTAGWTSSLNLGTSVRGFCKLIIAGCIIILLPSNCLTKSIEEAKDTPFPNLLRLCFNGSKVSIF